MSSLILDSVCTQVSELLWDCDKCDEGSRRGDILEQVVMCVPWGRVWSHLLKEGSDVRCRPRVIVGFHTLKVIGGLEKSSWHEARHGEGRIIVWCSRERERKNAQISLKPIRTNKYFFEVLLKANREVAQSLDFAPSNFAFWILFGLPANLHSLSTLVQALFQVLPAQW